jgi:hypothetical protein
VVTDGGAVAAVLVVDVLDDFLAPVVLEVHVDVGRLAALLADEALEQQMGLLGVHRRDAQHVADDGIGRRTAPLAQDAHAARKLHDVVYREEVHLVLAVRDQLQLLANLRRNRLGHSLGIQPGGVGFDQPGQALRGSHAGRHRLQRVLVLDLVQAEGAALCHGERGRQQVGRVDARQTHAAAQVSLSVRLQCIAAFRHAAPQPHGRDHVLQRLAQAAVHVHVARSHQRQAQGCARLLQGGQPEAVVRRQVQFYRHPHMALET